MPFQSDRQRRFIYAKAGEGAQWARKFVRDAGDSSGMASYTRLASKMVGGRRPAGGTGVVGFNRNRFGGSRSDRGRGGTGYKPRKPSGGSRYRPGRGGRILL